MTPVRGTDRKPLGALLALSMAQGLAHYSGSGTADCGRVPIEVGAE